MGILEIVPLPDSFFWLRSLAHGDASLPAGSPRRARLFWELLSSMLSEGEFRERVLATGGLRASSWSTREKGSLVLIENPTEETLTGAVFPGIAQITLGPGEIFPWVHDFPLGPSASYLSAYAGLVKCDARLIAAHIRPDPFVGARIFVYGEIGETKNLVLFGGGRGEETKVTFTDAPQILSLAESEIISLPESLADQLFLPDAPQVSLEPTLLGRGWLLWPDGTLEKPGTWPETDSLSGWLWTRITVPAETDARLDGFSGSLWVNGAPAPPQDFPLNSGENYLLIYAEAPLDAPLLIPDGACYLLELTRWKRRPAG